MTISLTPGSRYHILRLLHNLSQADLNKVVNKSKSWCSQLERDCFELSVQDAIKLCALYKITLGQLLGTEPISLTLTAA
jgi:transcriptional regulator with XRE-family HTH domain